MFSWATNLLLHSLHITITYLFSQIGGTISCRYLFSMNASNWVLDWSLKTRIRQVGHLKLLCYSINNLHEGCNACIHGRISFPSLFSSLRLSWQIGHISSSMRHLCFSKLKMLKHFLHLLQCFLYFSIPSSHLLQY